MQSALDAFRAQCEAADRVHARLTEVAQLLKQLTKQVDAVAGNAELRAILRDEQSWLQQAQVLMAGVRHLREQERLRYWPGIWRRWAPAALFGLTCALAAGAGYAWWTEPYTAELKALQERVELADAIAVRMVTMTVTERRQFERLMGSNVSTKP